MAAQTRLQQLEQPGQGSPSMVQLPVVWMALHVPAVLPDGMVHLPLQQSVPLKQTSLIGWQPAPVVMQVPPWQFLEQQVLLSLQALPSVLQLPATIGWQVPLTQLPPQQAASLVQALPSCVHTPVQAPLTQLRPQHCTDEVQAPLAATQPPEPRLPLPARMQLLEVGSQLPTQQSPSLLQVWPGGPHETPPSPPLLLLLELWQLARSKMPTM